MRAKLELVQEMTRFYYRRFYSGRSAVPIVVNANGRKRRNKSNFSFYATGQP